jgi:hypothetical protein
MDLSRSKYGRHTSETQLNDRDHIPNIASSLMSLHDNLVHTISSVYKDNVHAKFDQLTNLFFDFYQNALYLLGSDKIRDSKSESKTQTSQDDSLSEIFYKNESLIVPVALATFLELFDLKCPGLLQTNALAVLYANDLRLIINHIREQLYGNEFSTILKILCFIYALHMFKSKESLVQDAYKKRLSDLIKSEFALFKYNNLDNSAQPDDYDSCNRNFLNHTCYFNSFMLSLVEIGILANQYFKIRLFT